MTVKERLKALRILMKEKGIDAYLVPTDDFHGSEYVGDYFKCRKYITYGFGRNSGYHAGYGRTLDGWQILYSGGRSA